MILEASGDTRPALFTNAGRAFLSLITSPDDVSAALREKIILEASDPIGLAQRWIETLLNLARDQNYLFMDFPSLKIEGRDNAWSLDALAVGELIDPQRHTFPHRLNALSIQPCTLEESDGLFRLRFELKVL